MSESHWNHGVDPDTGEALMPSPEEMDEGHRGRELTRTALEEPVRSLDPRPAMCFAPTDSLESVIASMVDAQESTALIVENDVIIGIFTERDVLLRLHGGGLSAPFDEVTIAEVMTPDPETLLESDSLAFALNRMSVGGFRHIPIVTGPAEAGGHRSPRILSVRYLVSYLADFFPEIIYNLPPNPVRKGTARFGA